MNKLNFQNKNNGDTLDASEWNQAVNKIDELVEAASNGGSNTGGGGSDPHITFDSTGKHNLTIETTSTDQYVDGGKTKGGKINIESISDIQLKPGDDIILYSHHRPVDKQDEVTVKVTDGDDKPVKLQLNPSEILLTTKGKTGTDANVLDISINEDTNVRGYLKVRAQAIDLRCEKHGGIALQPKGYDDDGNMNKIKFEHGGGDGLEFGTFNTEKSSLYTDEYRFKKNGIIKLATRETEDTNKTIRDENTPTGKIATAAKRYIKQSDDFYDIIDNTDPKCTWEDIVNAGCVFYVDHSAVKYKTTRVIQSAIPGGEIIPIQKEYDIIIDHGSQDSSYSPPPTIMPLLGKIYDSISDLENALTIPTGTLSNANVDFSENIHTVLNIKHTWIVSNSTDPNMQDAVMRQSNPYQVAFDSFCDTMVKTPKGDISLDDIYTVVNYFKINNNSGPFASN